MGKKAVHFGAGNIGRGFVAEFLHKSGFEVVFADVMETIINSLQASSHYTVTEISADGESTSKITNYRAINSKTNEADVVAEIATSDLVTCAVGPRILKFIAPVIAKGIQARSSTLAPLAVVACENAIGATDTLAEFILSEDNTPKDQLDAVKEKVRFGNSAIDRIVPAQDADAGLNVKIEKFYDWVIDRSNWKGEPHPEIVGVDFVDDLEPYIERKLYTVNTGHATAAYYGHNRGKRTIHDAMSDPDIHDRVRHALAATSHLIVNKHGITEEQQKAYVEKIITRISNPHLEDVVERVGRAPLRKLGPKERFIGPASQLVEMGHDANELMGPTEMAFRFQNVEGDEESEKLATIMKENSAEEVVKQVCELEPSHALFPRIVEIVKKVQADSK